MCGFAGFVSCNNTSRYIDDLSLMGQSIYHRGPDDTATWINRNSNVGLVHRRLSILDLSNAGRQPMISASKRYVIVFNGEIYNHLDLRKNIVNEWVGNSDTETLLAHIDQCGIINTLDKLIGMFSFAVWDNYKEELTLVRDRMGEKPLYYGMQGNVFLFGSEIKALKKHSEFKADIDKDSVGEQLKLSYIPAPYTIYKNIFKLLPGQYKIIRIHNRKLSILENKKYWCLYETSIQRQNNKYKGNIESAINQLEDLLIDSVNKQMISDVPLGAFLSGGIDSSLVVSLMASISSAKIKTFTIGFDKNEFNEAKDAENISNHLKTDHHTWFINPNEALDVIDKLPNIFDEPFADPSQIPTYLVSKFTKNHVKVALSGDGGDELFGGYNRYISGMKMSNIINRIPYFFRKKIASGVNLIPDRFIDIIGRYSKYSEFTTKINKISNIFDLKEEGQIYNTFLSKWINPSLLLNSHNYKERNISYKYKFNHLEYEMMCRDAMGYLPDDILTKLDRCSMSVSLESRVPFLDHRIVEYAWSLPLEYKINKFRGKVILREILKKYLPVKFIDKPKMGFTLPINDWLRGPLKNWADNLLSKDAIEDRGLLNSQIIMKEWESHLTGEKNSGYKLWNILMLQAWLNYHE